MIEQPKLRRDARLTSNSGAIGTLMMMPRLCSDRRHAFIRSCIYQCDLDLRRSSGRGEQRFRPLQLATRLKCPSCGSRRVALARKQTTHSVPISSGSRQNDPPVRLLENHSAICCKADSRDERHPDRNSRVSDDVAPVQIISSLCKTKPSFVLMASARTVHGNRLIWPASFTQI